MGTVRLSALSVKDVEKIVDGISLDRPRVAIELVEKLYATCDLLAANPTMGTSRNELLAGLRAFSVESYVIYFRPLKNGIRVYRIVHGGRSGTSLFRGRQS